MGNRKSIDDKMPIDSPLKISESSNASSTDLRIDETITEDLDKSDVCATPTETKTETNNKNDLNKTKASRDEPTNENNNNNINIVPKPRARSSGKKSTSAASCTWCHDERAELNFYLPTGDLEFCSEGCIVEFQKAVKKGACRQCGNVIQSTVAPNRVYCSTACLNKAKPTNGKTMNDCCLS